jgi:nuclear transport factor 2 (NTF2) superfamily protein
MQTTEGSGRPKVLINYEAAREWLQQKWQRQRERRLA